jgi:hypothetical protein
MLHHLSVTPSPSVTFWNSFHSLRTLISLPVIREWHTYDILILNMRTFSHFTHLICSTVVTVKYNAMATIDSQSSLLLQMLDDVRKDLASTHEAQAKTSGLLRWQNLSNLLYGIGD